MAQTTVLQVDLVDPTGSPFSADQVTFDAGGTQVVSKAAPFLFDLNAKGSASIEIQSKGHHTYHFDLNVTDAGTDFTVSIDQKSMIDAPRMVTLLKLGASGKGTGPGRNQMTVTIGKVREIVLVTGFDYPSRHGPGGMQFHLLATKRMHEIRTAKSLDDSTVVTWFDCKSGLRTRWVTGRGTEKPGSPPAMWSSGWARLSSDGTPPSTLDPNDTTIVYPGPNVNGMPEIYQHIGSIGSGRPGTLEEFSVMSHSWFGGPILFDTGEQATFAQIPKRDPADRDGRFWKDFDPVNMPFKANFIAAFSKSPFIRVWGCLATRASLDVIKKAARAKSDTQNLGIPVADRTLWFDGTTVFDDNRPGIIKFIKQSLLKSNYMASLATVTGHPVEGGAPGMGALFTPLSATGFQMFVARSNVTTTDKKGKKSTIVGFKREMEFLEKRVGAKFSVDGYLQYQP